MVEGIKLNHHTRTRIPQHTPHHSRTLPTTHTYTPPPIVSVGDISVGDISVGDISVDYVSVGDSPPGVGFSYGGRIWGWSSNSGMWCLIEVW